MASQIHLLQLEPYDDSVSTRDRLKFVEARYVLLVWPANAPALRRKLDLLLVQREALRLGIWLALVTQDPSIIEHAEDLNISVFPSVRAARRGGWKRPRGKMFVEPRSMVDPDGLADHVSRLRGEVPLTEAQIRRRQLTRWGIFAGVWLLLAVVFLVVAPRATVTVYPASEQVSARVRITADTALSDIDLESYSIPAVEVVRSVRDEVSVTATGVRIATPARATGQVVFTNISERPVVVPSGTIVATLDVPALRYETLNELTLQPGRDGTVKVQALEESAGTKGNIRAGNITVVEGELSARVTATNPNAMSGGAIRELSTVTDADYASLRAAAIESVETKALAMLLHEFPAGLVPNSVAVVVGTQNESFSALVGEPTERVLLVLEAQVRALVINEDLARDAAYAGLAPRVAPGREMLPNTLTYEFNLQSIPPGEAQGQRVTFEAIVTGRSTISINDNYVRERVAGASKSEARDRLKRELLLNPNQPVSIRVWPGWYGRLPLLPLRIDVDVATP